MLNCFFFLSFYIPIKYSSIRRAIVMFYVNCEATIDYVFPLIWNLIQRRNAFVYELIWKIYTSFFIKTSKTYKYVFKLLHCSIVSIHVVK